LRPPAKPHFAGRRCAAGRWALPGGGRYEARGRRFRVAGGPGEGRGPLRGGVD
jgi:hypothetical protein